ncbi:MAG: DUF2384 domain-containing protein [Saprospirales bacterium]|nr:MAG: DUF2384 domain-containing protein [Saprospirales bacterium]
MILSESNYSSRQHYDKLTTILGQKYVSEKIENPFDFIKMAINGIDAEIIMNFGRYFNLTKSETARLLSISEPTLYRWIKSAKPLDRKFSIQLFELTDLFLYGTEVFEKSDYFFKWLDLPNAALGGLAPVELLDVPGGIDKVKDLLGRIDYGVYS